MKVITSNPLYIDDRQVSEESKYLSFDGGNTDQVKAFQDWMDISHPGWYRGGNLNQGKKYGRMDRFTKKANRTYGGEFDGVISSGGTRGSGTATTGNYLGKVNPITGEFTPPNANYSNTAPDGRKKKGAFWNKAKGGWEKAQTVMSKTQGVLDKVNSVFGMFGKGPGPGTDVEADYTPTYDTSEEDEGMSKGLKIGLIVGGVALTALVIILIVRQSKKGKAKAKK